MNKSQWEGLQYIVGGILVIVLILVDILVK